MGGHITSHRRKANSLQLLLDLLRLSLHRCLLRFFRIIWCDQTCPEESRRSGWVEGVSREMVAYYCDIVTYLKYFVKLGKSCFTNTWPGAFTFLSEPSTPSLRKPHSNSGATLSAGSFSSSHSAISWVMCRLVFLGQKPFIPGT